MSQSTSDTDISKYKSTTGLTAKTGDYASDENVLKQRFGTDESQKKFTFPADIIAERMADWYDDKGATFREYLSNAETACIRRARMELKNAGLSVPEDTGEMFEKVEESAGYTPVIEVTYNQKPSATRFIIEDNGCGITTTEYQVLRNIGYSASHDDGSRLGQFGMGIMSFLNLVGVEGAIRLYTNSFPSENRESVAYSLLMYATNLEYLDDVKESYGTRFEFPDFSDKAGRVNVRSKIEEYAEGMRVPVLYTEFGQNGKEIFNDDYIPSDLSDDYDDESLVVKYENQFFEAVMSPSRPNGRDYKTYNISMPIRRNTSVSTYNSTFNARWEWDFRGKSENGPIVHCETDKSLVGKIPISSTKFNKMDDEESVRYISYDALPDDAIQMPAPASSRDSYEGGFDKFWYHVSDKLSEVWEEMAADRFEKLTSWDDFIDMSTPEKETVVRAYREFGPRYGEDDADKIQETLQNNLGVTVPKDICEKISGSLDSVRVVREGTQYANLKRGTRGGTVWKLLDKDVYIGQSISQKKAEIAWGIDAHVVKCEVDKYDELQNRWGWKLLKNIPTSNLKEELPEIDDDVAEKWENTSNKKKKSTSTSPTSRRKSRDPRTKRIKVRVGTGRKKYNEMSVGDIYDTLDSGETIYAGNYQNHPCQKLIIYDQTEGYTASSVTGVADSGNGIAVAVVPKYVYKYLISADNVYENKSEVRKEYRNNKTVELSDGTKKLVKDLDEDDIFFNGSRSTEDEFKGGREDALLNYINKEKDMDAKRLTFIDANMLKEWWFIDEADNFGATIFCEGRMYLYGTGFSYEQLNIDISEILMNEMMDGEEIDFDHEAMKAIFSTGNPKNSTKKLRTIVEYFGDSLPTK